MKPSERWLRLRRADLLSKASEAERVAYRILCALGYKVIRQYPINTGRRIYFADLYIPALKLILEVDGNYHLEDNQKRLDSNRSSGIWRLGYHVVRLSNRDARDPEKIEAKINLILKKST
jgi:very-short-patch-repair endonuclease